jgi:hypothetical protein
VLAEKFILFLEALRRSDDSRHADGAPKVIYTSEHVPVKLPPNKSLGRSIPRLVAIGGRRVDSIRAGQA